MPREISVSLTMQVYVKSHTKYAGYDEVYDTIRGRKIKYHCYYLYEAKMLEPDTFPCVNRNLMIAFVFCFLHGQTW